MGGFFWGFGQMAGGMINDTIDGRIRSTGDYLGVWGQNIIAGVEGDASIDAALITGGMGWAAFGALGSAGLGALTFDGKGKSAEQFAKDQVIDAGLGAVGGAALSRLAPLAGKLDSVALEKAARLAGKLPESVKATAGAAADWVARKTTATVESVAGRYVTTEADATIANVGQALQKVLTREGGKKETAALATPTDLLVRKTLLQLNKVA